MLTVVARALTVLGAQTGNGRRSDVLRGRRQCLSAHGILSSEAVWDITSEHVDGDLADDRLRQYDDRHGTLSNPWRRWS